MWQYAITFIKERPLWGWGSGTFPHLIENSTAYWRGHPHNLVLELAFSFGLLITLIIVLNFIQKISLKLKKKWENWRIYNSESLFLILKREKT